MVGPTISYGSICAEPWADIPVPPSLAGIVISNALVVTLDISNVLLSNWATVKSVSPPPGKDTDENFTYLPTLKPWLVLLTVTVAEAVVESNVAPAIPVAKGLMS